MRYGLFFLLLAALAFPVRAEVLDTVVSAHGEEKIAFVQRVARMMQAWTRKTGYEACGMIGQAPEGRLGVVMETSREASTCLIQADDHPPAGWVMTEDDIHTHPEYRRGQYARSFSPADYDHPGYLVERGRLWHQRGRGTETDLGPVGL